VSNLKFDIKLQTIFKFSQPSIIPKINLKWIHSHRNPTLATPTPGFDLPKSVTEQQALYVKGFEDALKDIKAKEQYHHYKPHEEDYINPQQPMLLPDQIPLSFSSNVSSTNEKITSAFNMSKQPHQEAFIYSRQPTGHLPPPPPLILAPFSAGGDMSRPSSGASGSFDSSIESHYLNSNVSLFKLIN
jgi:hypothetical protein